jgi:ABC-2 type transport system ATP-binding protein
VAQWAHDERRRRGTGKGPGRPQDRAHLTLTENLRYFGTVPGLRGQGLSAAVTATIGSLGLTGLEQRLVGTFSGGQLARVGLAGLVSPVPSFLCLSASRPVSLLWLQ